MICTIGSMAAYQALQCKHQNLTFCAQLQAAQPQALLQVVEAGDQAETLQSCDLRQWEACLYAYNAQLLSNSVRKAAEA